MMVNLYDIYEKDVRPENLPPEPKEATDMFTVEEEKTEQNERLFTESDLNNMLEKKFDELFSKYMNKGEEKNGSN